MPMGASVPMGTSGLQGTQPFSVQPGVGVGSATYGDFPGPGMPMQMPAPPGDARGDEREHPG